MGCNDKQGVNGGNERLSYSPHPTLRVDSALGGYSHQEHQFKETLHDRQEGPPGKKGTTSTKPQSADSQKRRLQSGTARGLASQCAASHPSSPTAEDCNSTRT